MLKCTGSGCERIPRESIRIAGVELAEIAVLLRRLGVEHLRENVDRLAGAQQHAAQEDLTIS